MIVFVCRLDLRDIAIKGDKSSQTAEKYYLVNEQIDFPIKSDDVIINKFNSKQHYTLIEEWTSNEFDKEFLLLSRTNSQLLFY